MKTLLLSIFALAIVAAPVRGENDKDNPKPVRKNAPPPQRHVNPAPPRTVTPRVQTNVAPKRQFQPQSKPPVTNRNYAPPKSYTPEIQAKLRNNSPKITPAPRTNNTTLKQNPAVTRNPNWRNRDRTDSNVITPQTNVTPNTTVRNRDWQNRNNNNTRNRNWQNNNNRSSTFTFEQARRRHHRDRHDRSWWRSRSNRIVLFGGGYYFWDNNYWYPAYGYDPAYSTYAYDEPIYGYNDLAPGQVIANVQSALQEQGYYNDAVDGLIGPNTRAALSHFQRDHGLSITAAIDGPTLQALGLD
jgi:putative peptidoglycan binding protein